MMRVSVWRIKYEAHQAIYSVDGVTSLARDVHFNLVTHCNIETLRCFPSEKRLAELVQKTDRSVRSAIKQLQGLGVISIQRNQGRSGTNQYVLHLLERKILEHRPEENGVGHRQDISAKQGKEKRKEKARGANGFMDTAPSRKTVNAPLKFEIVSNRDSLEMWDRVIGDLNLGSSTEIMKLVSDESGYRLPSQEPGRDSESRLAIRRYVLAVVATGGACLDQALKCSP